MFAKSPQFQVRILRFWSERYLEDRKIPTWRFSLENPETGERHTTTDLDDILVCLLADIQQTMTDNKGEFLQ